MGKAIKWLKALFGIKKENVNKCKIRITCFGNFARDTVVSVAVDGGSGGLCHNPVTIPPNITAAEAAWLSSFDKEQSKHAIVVAAATAATADAAVAAAHAADAVVRLASQNRGNGAAMKIQTVFRGFLARKALRALKGLVKLQALVRGYLVRKQASATLHGMQALMRAQASVRGKKCFIKNQNPQLHHARKSLLVLNLVELRNTHEVSETFPKFIMSAPVTPNPGKALLTDRNGGGSLKAGLRKFKFLKALSFRRHKKAYHAEEGSSSDGRNSVRSEDPDYVYPVDTDSLDEDLEGESEEGKEDTSVQKSFSYEALVYANHAGGSFCSNTSGSSSDEDLVHYSHHISDTRHKYPEDTTAANQSAEQSSKRSLLSWRKRKLSFKSPKTKGEPLLKKHYGEDGGDDIDFDRRQLCSSDESSSRGHKSEETSPISVSEFGDESFAVGSWEKKEIISRDGQMKLQTRIFFASIDQRSEQAAGESACTALVAVIADWFHCNPEDMPIKSQLDSLICEGSMQWRDLCENETYRERFPDKHFDLETVLEAKVRPLSVVSEKSFIGFFHPEGIEEEEGFHFLHGAMSFDNIWDEISKSAQETPRHGDSCVYIVGWNDHFFILKVEKDANYIIDTLGERLFEGCNQAYILKFDQDTTIMQVPSESQQSDDKPSCDRKEKTDVKEAADECKIVMSTNSDDSLQEDRVPEKNIIYRGKEACKEYIKSFLAAIPIRELQVDVKKGLMASTPLHQRLQIEFHYTMSIVPKFEESSSEDLIANSLSIVPSAAAE